MNTPLRHAMAATAGAAVTLLAVSAHAQSFDQYLSPTVPGYDQDRGSQIQQRPRTEYDPLGVHAGDFIIRPHLDEAVTYSSNVLGTRPAVGSAIIATAPQVDFNSDWARNSFGGSFGLSDQRYLQQRLQNRTDWNASLGGTYQIGNDIITVGATEIYQHEVPTDIDSATLTRPLGFKVTDIRLRYTTSVARFQLEPNLEYIGYRFDDQLLPGTTIRQKARDRDIGIAGVTARYGNWPERSLVMVLRAIDSHYTADLGGAPRPDSVAYEGLVGVDYAISGNLQVLALVGYEVRNFLSSAYANRSSPVTEASVIWTPSGLTTITGKISRTIEDSIGETTAGATETRGTLLIDHEYQRNIILQGRASIDHAAFSGSQGTQTVYSAGASATYRLNRNMRVTASYDFLSRTGSTNGTILTLVPTTSSAVSQNAGDYNSHVITVNLRFAL